MNPKSNVKIVIFDLYNTLIFPPTKKLNSLFIDFSRMKEIDINTAINICNGIPAAYLYDCMGINPKLALEFQLLNDFSTIEKLALAIKDKYRKKFDLEDVRITEFLYAGQIRYATFPIEIKHMLDKLRKEKIIIGLVSNLASAWKPIIDRFFLRNYFDIIVLSCEVGLKKPNSAIFNFILEQAKCMPCESIMIGDSIENDIIVPKSLGMKTIWFKYGANHLKHENTLTNNKIITTCTELESILMDHIT